MCNDDLIYRIWFVDGSETIFTHKEREEYGKRFGFDASKLGPRSDIYLLDEDGEVVGGVVEI